MTELLKATLQLGDEAGVNPGKFPEGTVFYHKGTNFIYTKYNNELVPVGHATSPIDIDGNLFAIRPCPRGSVITIG